MPKNLLDRIGKTYGFLTIKEQGASGPRNRTMWWCSCTGPDGECSNRVLVANSSLVSGNTKSCGCITSIAKARPLQNPGIKKCSICKSPKDLGLFAKDRKRYDGRTPECRECRNLARKGQRRAKPILTLLKRAQYRAKEKAVAFCLEVEDVHLPEYCPCCAAPLRLAEGKGPADDSPSIDRIIPELGYVKGNVEVICTGCNRIKNDATNRRLLKVALAAYKRSTPAERQEFLSDLQNLSSANSYFPSIESLEEARAH